MIVHFINPQGRHNYANLSNEGLIILKSMLGYIIKDEADFDLPVVPSRLRVHQAPGDNPCTACES